MMRAFYANDVLKLLEEVEKFCEQPPEEGSEFQSMKNLAESCYAANDIIYVSSKDLQNLRKSVPDKVRWRCSL